MQRLIFNLIIVSLSLCLLTCKGEEKPASANLKKVVAEKNIPSKPVEVKKTKENPKEFKKDSLPTHLLYPFQKSTTGLHLRDIIPEPKGFSRIPVDKNSFAEWLRYLPVKPKGTAVKLFNGALKPNQNVHDGVIDIDVGKRDLQQCADAVMRLQAEYQYSRKNYTKIHFNFTSGDKVAFEDWSKGRKPKISGNKVTFSSTGSTTDTSYPNFKKYMTMIFNYAGTASLSKELKKVALSNMEIGDVFIQGGFPGHAVIIIDMAQNNAGEKVFLLAQSYMPAQDIHILKNYYEEEQSPWYSQEFEDQLNTPEWTFHKDDLKRFSN